MRTHPVYVRRHDAATSTNLLHLPAGAPRITPALPGEFNVQFRSKTVRKYRGAGSSVGGERLYAVDIAGDPLARGVWFQYHSPHLCALSSPR